MGHFCRKMKLASILLSGLVFAQDPDERGKQQKKCENTPSECGQCLNMGTKSVEFCGFELRCLQLGFKNGECCSTKHPQTCQDCKALGDSCIQNHNQEKTCKKLGYKDQKTDCPGDCPTAVPSTCEECEAISEECRERQGFDKVCTKLELGKFIKNKCPKDCSSVEKDTELLTCQQWQALGEECSGECENAVAPTTCNECIESGKTCIRETGSKKTCKDLHYKKGKCAPPCTTNFAQSPSNCAQCDALGARCVKKLGHEKSCKKHDWNKKKGCPKKEE